MSAKAFWLATSFATKNSLVLIGKQLNLFKNKKIKENVAIKKLIFKFSLHTGIVIFHFDYQNN